MWLTLFFLTRLIVGSHLPAGLPASVDFDGGVRVPGLCFDSIPPHIVDREVTHQGVVLWFDEAVVGEAAFLFLLDGQSIAARRISDRQFSLDFRVEVGKLYTITLLPDYTDRAGNAPATAIELPTLLGGAVQPGELLINELMFDPAAGTPTFIELYNNSNQTICLYGYRLSGRSTTGDQLLIDTHYMLPPGELVVLTPDPRGLVTTYLAVDTMKLLTASLLTDRAGGTITLSDSNDQIIDAFDYQIGMHTDSLGTSTGVSLERIAFGAGTQEQSNWASAASRVNFGSPTRTNSQSHATVPEGLSFELATESFSPDGDGQADILEVVYFTDRPGLLSRVSIFDIEGRLVRELPQSTLQSGQGSLQWDGICADGRVASDGEYVLLIEVLDGKGHSERYKLVALLAS